MSAIYEAMFVETGFHGLHRCVWQSTIVAYILIASAIHEEMFVDAGFHELLCV